MNTLWLKIASGVIGILIVIVLISLFMPGGDEKTTPQEPNDITLITNPWEQGGENSIASENDTDNTEVNPIPVTESDETESPTPVEPRPVLTVPETTETTIYVKQLNSMEQKQAMDELDYAMRSFNVGNMPAASYRTAVDAARRIIRRWPESLFAFNSKLLLSKIPSNLHREYNITQEELDTSKFYQTRAGTVPIKIKIEDHS